MPRFRSLLRGRYEEYFDLFEAAATNNVQAAELLTKMMAGFPESAGLARSILVCEQNGDQITHDLTHRVSESFGTPIDRDDVLRLASDLDDIVDLIEEVADYLGLYRIEAPMEQAQQLTEILLSATRQIAEAMPNLRDFTDLSARTAEIGRLETDGDRVTREAIASLFEQGVDPVTVIRWKDIFERLEGAIDATEHVAHTLEAIVIKHA